MEIILADIKESEFKINYLKNYVHQTEDKRKEMNKLREEKEIKYWNISLSGINTLKQSIANEKINRVKRNINLFNHHMNTNTIYNQKKALDFDEKLTLFQTQKTDRNVDEIPNYDDLDEKNEKAFKRHKVMMENIRKKLEERMKSKKDKEKRERQQLKDEKLISRSFSLDKNKEMNKNNFNTINSIYKDIYVPSITGKEENIQEKDNINDVIEPTSSKVSTFSKLTKGDYYTNLIKNSFSIHKGNIKIGNRINFFKTIIESNNKTEKLLPEIRYILKLII